MSKAPRHATRCGPARHQTTMHGASAVRAVVPVEQLRHLRAQIAFMPRMLFLPTQGCCYQRLRHCLTVQSSCSTNEPLLNPHRIRGAMLFWKQSTTAWRQLCQGQTSDLRRGLRGRSSHDSSCDVVLAQGASKLDSRSVIEHPLTSP